MRFLRLEGLDVEGRFSAKLEKVRAAVERDDFRSPDLKKLEGPLHRVKLDEASRLLAPASCGPPTAPLGSVVGFSSGSKAIAELDEKTRRSAKVAVVVLRDEHKAAAREHFRTPLVFSVLETKGLEYDSVILFRLVSSERKTFAELCEGVTRAELEVEALDYRRAKDEGDRSLEAFKFFVNALYVALTRAVTNVYLVEDDPTHPLLGLLEVPFDGGPRAFEAALRFAAAVWNIEVARERGWTPASVEELRAKLAPGVPGDAPQGLRRAGRAEARPVRGRPPDGRHLEAQALGARLRRGDAGVAASRDDRPRDRGRPHALTSGGLASTCC